MTVDERGIRYKPLKGGRAMKASLGFFSRVVMLVFLTGSRALAVWPPSTALEEADASAVDQARKNARTGSERISELIRKLEDDEKRLTDLLERLGKDEERLDRRWTATTTDDRAADARVPDAGR